MLNTGDETRAPLLALIGTVKHVPRNPSRLITEDSHILTKQIEEKSASSVFYGRLSVAFVPVLQRMIYLPVGDYQKSSQKILVIQWSCNEKKHHN